MVTRSAQLDGIEEGPGGRERSTRMEGGGGRTKIGAGKTPVAKPDGQGVHDL